MDLVSVAEGALKVGQNLQTFKRRKVEIIDLVRIRDRVEILGYQLQTFVSISRQERKKGKTVLNTHVEIIAGEP